MRVTKVYETSRYNQIGVVVGDDVNASGQICPACGQLRRYRLINATPEAAKVRSPVIVQFSNGGAAFVAGKGLKRRSGSANYGRCVRWSFTPLPKPTVFPYLHTDHAAVAAGIDGLLDAGEAFCRDWQAAV